ncbi:MAG TPA: arginine--tRNA ligase [Candidatus Aminicenantes bacterium]|nr:arginine--tRNA ligase [Candidatus Aminicenantes bacterium]
MNLWKKALQKKIKTCLTPLFPLEENDLELTQPPSLKMGDVALPVAFRLAKKLKKAPYQIAQLALSPLQTIEEVSKIELAGGGYLNLFLDRKKFIKKIFEGSPKKDSGAEEKKIIIEHTNINPNKAAHIGHLRNAVLGDTLARCLKYKGEKVEVQNYIDDTGVQVVDVVFGFLELEKKKLPEIQSIPAQLDDYCWDLYTRVSQYLQEQPEAQAKRNIYLKKVEKGEGDEARIAEYISRQIVQAHLTTMKRLGITYDVLPCESSILHLKFWEKAFQLLKGKEAISLAQDGPNKGCWVMPLAQRTEKEKVIVRSDGTVTYVGKDIAYQLWKFGLLGLDFYYEPFIEENGHTIWISTDQPTSYQVHFGGGSKVYNVIDTRQSYLQDVVVESLRLLEYHQQAENSIHFSYEMVALSPQSLKELGLQPPPGEEEKNFYEVSGRRGLGIKANDFLDQLEIKAYQEVNRRNPDLPEKSKKEIARQIACGALRYFMLKYSRNSLIVFDFDEALNFEGETGPYLQYTYVRIQSIFRKLKERTKIRVENLISLDKIDHLTLSTLSPQEKDEMWELIYFASHLDEEVLHSLSTLELSNLAKFTFNLCQKFNAYYHKYPILAEKDEQIQQWRIITIYYLQKTLATALELMGLPLPEKM